MSSIDVLIAEYAESAKKHGEATQSGDSKSANTFYDKMIENIKEIHVLDPKGNDFLELLNHENESVRLWSATHALFINESMAMITIQNIAKGVGILSFSASIVADEWNKGTLNSPF